MDNTLGQVTVTVLTKNSERCLGTVLEALTAFREVLVVDTGSVDQTISIANGFPNVVVYERPFEGFGPTHNTASALATNDWILSLDSDEVMTAGLLREIEQTNLDPRSVYSFWRKNYYRGRHIRGCGWYPDRVVRLYHRKSTQFSGAYVHEAICTAGMNAVQFSEPVLHYPYASVSSFLRKMELYSDLYAQQRTRQRASLWSAAGHALFAFCKTYFLQRGFLLGGEGFEIAWFNMNCAFYKYAKIAERAHPRSCDGQKKTAGQLDR